MIKEAKLVANKDKLRWSTTFALPVSEFTVKDTEMQGDWSNNDNVITDWLPSWWTKMILDQKDGRTERTESIVIDDTGLPTDVDLSWTTSTSVDPTSVWTGSKLWEGYRYADKDFNSRVIAGVREDVVVPPTIIVDQTEDPVVMVDPVVDTDPENETIVIVVEDAEDADAEVVLENNGGD